MENNEVYVVKEKWQENHDTTTLALTFLDGSTPFYKPGQFISVYFPELNTPEGKSYSISSAPHEAHFTITVKAIGEFSNKLCALNKGNHVVGSLPYGFFYSEEEATDLIMIAGGIGITPFRSSILHAQQHTPTRILRLFHSIRNKNDTLFEDTFKEMPNLETYTFITRDPIHSEKNFSQRICIGDILRHSSPARSEFFVCGSIPFVRDIWNGLTKEGVSEEKIYTEAFFSH